MIDQLTAFENDAIDAMDDETPFDKLREECWGDGGL